MKKRLFSVLLIGAMIMSLFAGCGKPAKDGGDNPSNQQNAGEKYIYTAKSVKIENEKDGYSVGEVLFRDGRINVLLGYYNGETGIQEGYEYVSCLIDGSDRKTVSIPSTDATGKDAYPTFWNVNEDGSIDILFASYNNQGMAEKYVLQSFDAAGQPIGDKTLDALMNVTNESYIGEVLVDADGNFIVSTDMKIVKISREGEILSEINSNTYLYNMFLDEKGEIYAEGWFGDKQGLAKIDLDAKTIGDVLAGAPENGNKWVSLGDGKYYVVSDSGLYLYDMNTLSNEQILSWVDSDLDVPWPATIFNDAEGNIVYIENYYEEESSGIEVVTLTKTLDNGNKKEIIFGCLYSDSQLSEKIRAFNRANTEYKVVVKDYENYGDYNSSMEAFKNDMLNGALDIVNVGLVEDELKVEDVCEDLKPYVDGANGLNKEDYFENVLKALEINGKMYSIAPTFNIFTLAANGKYTGNKTSWNTEEFLKVNQEFDGLAFGEQCSAGMLLYYLIMRNSEIIDLDTNTCNFNSKAFLDILEVIKEYPAEPNYTDDYDPFKELMDENVIFETLYISGVDTLQVYDKVMNDNMVVIGFPCETGAGHYFTFYNSFGITKNSANKDGAWEFLKMMMETCGEDTYYSSGFPVSKAGFDKAMEKMKSENGGGSWSSGGVSIEFQGVRDEDIELVRSLVEIAQGQRNYDQQVYDIMNEEITPLLKGEKTPQEIADVLQSRVSLYLLERQ